MAAGGQKVASAVRKDPFAQALHDLFLNEADRAILEAELITDAAMLSALSEDDLVSIGIPALEQRRARPEVPQPSVP